MRVFRLGKPSLALQASPLFREAFLNDLLDRTDLNQPFDGPWLHWLSTHAHPPLNILFRQE
jgi:hypothetical protein